MNTTNHLKLEPLSPKHDFSNSFQPLNTFLEREIQSKLEEINLGGRNLKIKPSRNQVSLLHASWVDDEFIDIRDQMGHEFGVEWNGLGECCCGTKSKNNHL
jgi:hypothetical protein